MSADNRWNIQVFPKDGRAFLALVGKVVGNKRHRQMAVHKQQLLRLWALLRSHSTSTCVIEPRYRSRSYIEDYAAYYARCHYPYPKECVRLHFFKTQLDETKFRNAVLRCPHDGDPELEPLVRGYLGFVVLNPLPNTIVGKTCIKPPPVPQDRFLCISNSIEVNLFGIPLRVDSVPFQEQDRAVARCATAALSSALHQTSSLWTHPTFSSAAITEAASNVPSRTRAIPTEGLTGEQMVSVIRKAGLEPQGYSLVKKHFLRSVMYAYLSCDIPVLLCQTHEEWNKSVPVNFEDNGAPRHAVAVTGMRFDQDLGPQRFRSDRVKALLVHDDQAAPYAEVALAPDVVHECQKTEMFEKRIASAMGHPFYAEPMLAIVPLYHKIRIPLSPIKECIVKLDDALAELLPKPEGIERNIEWDIRLTDIARFRKFISKHLNASEQKERLLCTPFPKYLWQVTARDDAHLPVVDFLFDATDIGQQELFLEYVRYDPKRAETITHVMTGKKFRNLIQRSDFLLWEICELLSLRRNENVA